MLHVHEVNRLLSIYVKSLKDEINLYFDNIKEKLVY